MADDGEDYAVNLATYKAQLQQVEAALTNDPENEELLKLQQDLQEVIDLTSDLIQAAPGVVVSEEEIKELKEKWKVGDKCQACYSADGGFYNAVIDEVLEDGSVTVSYEDYETSEVINITKLRPPVENEDDASAGTSGEGANSNRQLTKKELLIKQREYKKRRQQKKADRQKRLEELHEKDKNKWLNFSSKASKVSKKGFVRKSIFSSPETVDGKVGVGTCGTSGQPMTKFKMPKHIVHRK